MARSKLRVTGFTRFFIVMIFVIPLAYLGASYYNGEDGVANIKRWLGIDQTEVVSPETDSTDPAPATDTQRDRTSLQDQELEYYKRRVEDLEESNLRLREQLWEKDQEIARLKEAAQ